MASHTRTELRRAATVLAEALRAAPAAPAPAQQPSSRRGIYDRVAEAA
jgi:hypothetical protein